MAEDLTIVHGNHQFGFGGNLQYWKGDYTSTSRANGNWIFNGSALGLGLADLMLGRVTTVEHGGLGKLPVGSWYNRWYRLDSRPAGNPGTRDAGVGLETGFRPSARDQRLSPVHNAQIL